MASSLDKNGFHLYCVSNGSQADFPNNTLTSFSNSFPIALLDPGSEYEVALIDITFDVKFKFPVPEDEPTFLFTTKSPADIGSSDYLQLTKNEIFQVPQRRANAAQLVQWLGLRRKELSHGRDTNTSNWTRKPKLPIIAAWHAASQRVIFGCFDTDKGKPWEYESASSPRHTLYVNTKAIDWLVDSNHEHSQPPAVTITIGSATFKGFNLNTNTSTYFGCKKDNFSESLYKPLVFVQCDQLEGHISNDKDHVKHLATLSVPNKDTTCYYEAQHPVYLKLREAGLNLRQIDIKLTDISGNPLPLRSGWATCVGLRFKRIPRERMSTVTSKHFMQVSSAVQKFHSKNFPNSFSVTLSQPLDLYPIDDWNVSLLSATIPLRFKLMLSNSDRRFSLKFVKTTTDTATGKKKVEDVAAIVTTMPDTLNTIDELHAYFYYMFKEYADISIDSITGGLRITPRQLGMILTMRSGLYEFLGNAPHPNMNIVRLTRMARESLLFEHPPAFDHHLPRAVFIYTNFTSYQLVSGEQMRILKIVPMSTNNVDSVTKSPYHTVQFKTLDKIKVTADRLSTLDFELRAQDGQLINFSPKIYPDLSSRNIASKRGRRQKRLAESPPEVPTAEKEPRSDREERATREEEEEEEEEEKEEDKKTRPQPPKLLPYSKQQEAPIVLLNLLFTRKKQ